MEESIVVYKIIVVPLLSIILIALKNRIPCIGKT